MSSLPFLLDEDVPEFLADELIRLEPAIVVYQVGLEGGPPKGTKDPGLLVFAENNKMVLITMDKSTMPKNLRAHHQQGRHTFGVLILRQDFPTASYSEDLILVWSSLDDNEMIDYSMYIPLQ
jgi:hypothetical protein